MRITEVQALTDGSGYHYLRISTEAGLVGFGEPPQGMPLCACPEMVRDLTPLLLGKDPRRVVQHWSGLHRHAWHRGGPPLLGIVSGLEQALWDLAGKAAQLPVSALLGRQIRDRIRMADQVAGNSPQEAADCVAASRGAGFTAGTWCAQLDKMAGVETAGILDRVTKTMEAMQAAAGSDYALAVDLGGRMSLDLVGSLSRVLESHKLLFVQVPFEECRTAETEQLSRQINTPVVMGVHLCTRAGVRKRLVAEPPSVLRLDPRRCGGMGEALLAAGLGRAHGASVVTGASDMGPIGAASCLQLGACIENLLVQEIGASADGCHRPWGCQNGYSDVPARPGLGIGTQEDLELHLAEMTSVPAAAEVPGNPIEFRDEEKLINSWETVR